MNPELDQTVQEMFLAAINVRNYFAYAPYSNFQVGVAVRTTNSDLYVGSNQENGCYRLGSCAEQIAFGNVPALEKILITGIAVVGSSNEITQPCGGCRQLFVEHCGPEVPVWMANRSADEVQETTVGILLSNPFDFREH